MKPLIVANWKMNPQTLAEVKRLFNLVKKGVKNIKNIEAVICPPFLYLLNLKSKILNLKLGAQDCFWEEKGAFTGEVSSLMLKNLGCKYVIVGHSERRRNLNETDEMVNRKLKAALKENLRPILCVGNKNRKREKEFKGIMIQMEKALSGIKKSDLKNLIITYDPVWAIGTGRACGIPEAKKVNLSIRKILKENVILYGGSVNSQNAGDFIEKAKFQGLLVGGASLNAQEFIKLVKNVSKD